MAENSSGSRNAVCGSRRASMPWMDAYTILSGAIGSGAQSDRVVRMSAYSSREGVSRSGLALRRPAKIPPATVAPASKASAKINLDRCNLKGTLLVGILALRSSKVSRSPTARRKIVLRGTEHVRLHWHARIDPDFRRGLTRVRPEEAP